MPNQIEGAGKPALEAISISELSHVQSAGLNGLRKPARLQLRCHRTNKKRHS